LISMGRFVFYICVPVPPIQTFLLIVFKCSSPLPLFPVYPEVSSAFHSPSISVLVRRSVSVCAGHRRQSVVRSLDCVAFL
jgi:hypothetical protein